MLRRLVFDTRYRCKSEMTSLLGVGGVGGDNTKTFANCQEDEFTGLVGNARTTKFLPLRAAAMIFFFFRRLCDAKSGAGVSVCFLKSAFSAVV